MMVRISPDIFFTCSHSVAWLPFNLDPNDLTFILRLCPVIWLIPPVPLDDNPTRVTSCNVYCTAPQPHGLPSTTSPDGHSSHFFALDYVTI